MSQIAGMLLMYLDEEDAFWGLSMLMSSERHAMHGIFYQHCLNTTTNKQFLLSGFFVPNFPKLKRFSEHHDRVIKKHLPKIAKHLQVCFYHIFL